MWKSVAVVRDGKILRQTIASLTEVQEHAPPPVDRRAHEAANIVQTALLIARCALAREESRGAHYRLDFPLKNDRNFQKHSVSHGDRVKFE